MAVRRDHQGEPASTRPLAPEVLLAETDWRGLSHARGGAEEIPAALRALLDPDPAIRARALEQGLEPVRHQNSIYAATLPAALYVAAILPDPRTAVVGSYVLDQRRQPKRRQMPLRAALLDWLHLLALDADDSCPATAERLGFEDPHLEALRAHRPALFHAVSEYLADTSQIVRHTALAAAACFAEHPALIGYRVGLLPFAEQLLATSADHRLRTAALTALNRWGEVRDFNAPGVLSYAPAPVPDPWSGGYAEDPLF